MVYGGKPSAACLNCKKRKIKCDEGVPACSQCVKSCRICPGYIQHIDLVLRDQTQLIQSRAQRKKAERKSRAGLIASDGPECSESVGESLGPQSRCTSLVPRGDSSSSSPEPAQAVSSESSLDNASYTNPIPRALGEDPIQPAVNALFDGLSMYNRHPDSARGLIALLRPLYSSARHDSLISLATSSVALAAVGGSLRRSAYYNLGYTLFGKAVQMTKAAIDDPVESLTDETLMTVMLLGLFERITQTAESSKRTCVHNNGALALVKHRKDRNGRSEFSRSLLLSVHTELVDGIFSVSGFNGPTSAEWAELSPYLPQNAAGRFSSITARVADLQVVSKALLGAPSRTVPEQSVAQVLKSAVEIDAMLAEWAEASIPGGWEWLPASNFNCPTETPRTLFVHQDRIDIYYDLWVAGLWNHYRVTRIMVQSIVLDCLSRVTWADSPQLMQQSRRAVRISQQMVDELCGSVPFHLGTKMGRWLADDARVEYPVHATIVNTNNQLGGWQLIEPLSIALKVACLREDQRQWITQQLIRLGNIFSVDLLNQTG